MSVAICFSHSEHQLWNAVEKLPGAVVGQLVQNADLCYSHGVASWAPRAVQYIYSHHCYSSTSTQQKRDHDVTISFLSCVVLGFVNLSISNTPWHRVGLRAWSSKVLILQSKNTYLSSKNYKQPIFYILKWKVISMQCICYACCS